MIVSQGEVRSKIDQVKVGYEGYKRQLRRADLTIERKGRLEAEIKLAADEIATLEKVAQLGRVEQDRTKIEEIVRERLATMRAKLAADPFLAALSSQERDLFSGEVRALVWALREDTLTLFTQELLRENEHHDPGRTDRALPAILIHTLEEAPEMDARANAAYDLGKLHITQAIPRLATAFHDHHVVADTAFHALTLFTDDELKEAGLSISLIERIKEARGG
ncbi:MAG: hypothetical protein IVW55_08705 [Chloroflexi bacterium]|nr:hypothetical protein [Chloroflexota bacterium]